MTKDLVRQYYASFGEQEWQRLTRPEGVIEFAVTTAALERYLPPRGHILDLGGGTGRYTIWLAEHGYRVVLADLSPELLSIARIKIAEAGIAAQIEDVVECDASDLARFDTAAFDAVLCLGPFYHLTVALEREQAVNEVVRVLRPGHGVAFVALMTIYTFLRRTLVLPDEHHHLADPAFVVRLMNEGVFLNDMPGRFNAGYGVRSEQVEPFFETRGLTTLALLADTGFAGSLAQELADLAQTNPSAYRAALDLIVQTAGDPTLLGGSTHLLYVGAKQ